ncbi:MAG TPA: RagB/SusD family nutrient uptake outer membrane protein [Gemmatimonadales bacterium]
MNRIPFTSRLRRSIGIAAALAAMPIAACTTTDDILDVTDPDIIAPGDIPQNATGAEALRVGALARFIAATSGYNGGSAGETLWLYTGLLADEYRSGDTFNQRDQTDERTITYENSNIENGYLYANRARVSASQAAGFLEQYSPDAPAWHRAEMYLVQAYIENMLGEAFCSGVPFSSIKDGELVYGEQTTTAETFERALAHADSGLALLTGATAEELRVRHALAVTRGRILLNQGRFAEAADAVRDVPTSYAYVHQHSQTSFDNTVWSMNVSGRRYIVADGEGTNGIDFARANDPRLPICQGGDAACTAIGVTNPRPFDTQLAVTMYAQMKWPSRETPATVVGGIEARLIEAEARLAAGAPGEALAILNTLRATQAGLAPLADAGSPEAQVDQLFRERAFWLFGTGHRLGDLRRLVRQYGRAPETVFPVGEYFKGGEYGTQTSIPIPQSEENNPNIGHVGQNAICLSTDA